MASLAAMVMPSSTETAVANGDTRTLHFYHTHTGETIDATFRVNGHYDPTVLRQLNHFLRDWRNNDEINMDPRLFDAVWEAYGAAGATDRIQIYSAYRSPETNAMLRRRSHAVAEHSQHMLGKAMDTTMPGFPMERIREAGMKLERGGVGWYPSANFVHLDVGGVRSWPRMPYEQLARLFPDGKTVHIPANGKPMPGYEEARAEIAARGGVDLPPAQESGGFFAWLFGGGNGGGAAHEDEEDRRAPVAVAAAAPPPAAPAVQQVAQVEPQAMAYAGNDQAQPNQNQPNQAPPLDGRVQVEGQPQEPLGRQVASLEPGDGGDKPMALAGVLPLPPRRPADLAMAADIPLPPIRPVAFDRTQATSIRYAEAAADSMPAAHGQDAIAGLITATRSGVPMLRRSSLPALITQGSTDRRSLPGSALAFASPETMGPDLSAVPLPVARPAVLAKPTGLRALRNRNRHQTSVAAAAPAVPAAPMAPPALAAIPEAPVLSGEHLTGLRRAARLMSDKAAL
jgi:uncharacterized protein YcbK (DUF882 family)